MIDGQNIFDQPVRNDLIIYDSIITQLVVCYTITISKAITR